MLTSPNPGSSASAASNEQAQLIATFYEAFSRRDAEAIVACYHPDVVFSDPAFGTLRGESAGDMWRMLCKSGKDLKVSASEIHADHGRGRAHWDAYYTFRRTGRKVHNSIDATFTLKDGLIREHKDDFSFWRWSKQALGASGLLLGWTPLVKNKVRGTAANNLRKAMATPS